MQTTECDRCRAPLVTAFEQHMALCAYCVEREETRELPAPKRRGWAAHANAGWRRTSEAPRHRWERP